MKPVLSLHTLMAATAIMMISCGTPDQEKNATSSTGTRPIIAAVNYPLAYFATRIAGDFADILFEVPAGTDPAFWNPTDDQVSAIQKADLILLNGAGYAGWTSSRIIPYEATVMTSSAFENKFIKLKKGIRHTHKSGTESHTHQGFASTTWLDLEQARKQASTTASALIEQFPEHTEIISAKLEGLLGELLELDRQMKAATALFQNTPLVVSHPVYQYWARAYGLSIKSLHWEPSQDLGAQEMSELAAIRKSNPSAKYLIWEARPSPPNITRTEMAGFTSIVVIPCGMKPSKGDFMSVMRENIASLKEGLGRESAPSPGSP